MMKSLCPQQSLKRAKQKSGFTLIEVLVVTGLTVIIMLGTVSLFMTFMLNQARVTRKQRVKTVGDNALKQIVQVLREARQIVNCDGDGSSTNSIIFQDLSGLEGVYDLRIDEISEGNSRIASSAGEATVYLTPEDIEASSFFATCYPSENSYFIRFNFTLEDSGGAVFSNQPTTQTFSASVSLRN